MTMCCETCCPALDTRIWRFMPQLSTPAPAPTPTPTPTPAHTVHSVLQHGCNCAAPETTQTRVQMCSRA